MSDSNDGPERDLNQRTVSVDPATSPTIVARPTNAAVAHAAPTAFDPPPDRFTARRELGRGGMGCVVEAYDVALGRTVAMKQMLSNGIADLARFEREARITAGLEHPGIVPIHDAGRTLEGDPYYVMRRIDGEPLDREVARRKVFSERISLLPNVLAACDAVGFAHARGVIHRDLKPANILIGPFGETLVIDWGLARTVNGDDLAWVEHPRLPDLTYAGVVAGTPGFMAPEQARGEVLDARADVHALGATLFFTLTNAVPYTGSSATEMIEGASADHVPAWARLPAETPRELRAILEKAMAVRREDRYADGTALAVDLRRYITGQLVGAYRYGAWEQLKRFVRRHRGAVAISAVAAIVISVGATISARRIVAERDEANAARARAEIARRDADDRSDQLIVQRAQELATTNPPAAIARLRTLSPTSRQWRAASVVASIANARGIPFGFSGVPLGPLAMSPDSTRVLASGSRAWHVEVFDLQHRTRQRIPAPAPGLRVRTVGWLDTTHIVISTKATTYVVSLAGGVRELPIELASLRASGVGRAWAVDKQRRAHAIDPVGVTVIDDIDDATPIDADRAVIRRGTVLAMWSAGTIVPFAKGVVEYVAALGRVVTKDAHGQVCTWTLTPPTRGQCAQEDPRVSIVAPRGGGFVTQIGTSEGELVHFWPAHGVTPQVIRKQFARRSTMGVLLDGPGTITTVGPTQTFTLEHNLGSINFIDQSADGRFLAAATRSEELVVWDLPAFRPVELGIGMGFKITAVTASSVWYVEHLQRLIRRDRATGRDIEVVVLPEPALDAAEVDATESWVAIGSERRVAGPGERDALTWTLRHLPSQTSITVPLDAQFYFDSGRAYRVDANGAIIELTPAAAPIATVDLAGKAPLFLIVRGDWILTGAANRVCRVQRSTRVSRCADFPGLTAANLAVDGVGFLAIDRAMHMWALDGTHTPRLPGVRVDDLHWTGTRMVAISVDGVAVLESAPRTVSTPKLNRIRVLDSERIAATAIDGSLLVIDLAAGRSFRAGTAQAGWQLFGVGDMIVFSAGPWHALTLPVPVEPAPLRAWLATVTNVQLVADDVVQWP